MKKVAIMMADGFEEIEALSPFDVFKRAGIECDLISIKDGIFVQGAHGIVIKADKLISDVDNMQEYDMIVLPGGMPGAKYLAESDRVISIIKSFNENKKYIAAICASPALVLSKAGVLENKKATCYPGMETNFTNTEYVNENVVVDESIITSKGPATALDFSYKLVEMFGVRTDDLKGGMLYKS